MKPTALLTIALLSLGLLASCNKSKDTAADKKAEKVAETPMQKSQALLAKLTTSMEKIVVAIESATDKASAEKAAASIKETSAELRALAPQGKSLKKELTEAEDKTMEADAQKALEPLMERMAKAMEKVMLNAEANEVLMPAIEEFQKSMSASE